MKFGIVIVLYNALLLLFAAAALFLPVFALGKEAALDFWRSLWYVPVITIGMLAVMNVYAALNYRVYRLLEKEDWPGLAQELEDRLYRRGRYSAHSVRLLANIHLILANPAAVTELEQKAGAVKAALVNKSALVFGAARLLDKNPEGAVEFFAARLKAEKKPAGLRSLWIRWYYGFSLFLSRRFNEAADAFLSSIYRDGAGGRPSGAVVTGLAAYFLAANLARFLPSRQEEIQNGAEAGRNSVRQRLKGRAAWDRALRRSETELHMALLSQYLAKAAAYIYGGGSLQPPVFSSC